VTLKQWLVDALERAAKTVAQVFTSALITLGVASNWTTWWHALDVALLAGAVSVLTSIVTVPLSTQLAPSLQVVFRAVLTFAQAALAYLAANTFVGVADVRWLEVLQVSIIAAIGSVLTSWASWNIGPAKGNPSVVPTAAPAGG
jgi:hypothetical protein